MMDNNTGLPSCRCHKCGLIFKKAEGKFGEISAGKKIKIYLFACNECLNNFGKGLVTKDGK